MGTGNFILDEALALKADGVIFHPILADRSQLSILRNAISFCPIDKLSEMTAYPKSGRSYYRLIDGKISIVEEKR